MVKIPWNKLIEAFDGREDPLKRLIQWPTVLITLLFVAALLSILFVVIGVAWPLLGQYVGIENIGEEIDEDQEGSNG
jgi:hypothetical protein